MSTLAPSPEDGIRVPTSTTSFIVDPFHPREGKDWVWTNVNMSLSLGGKEGDSPEKKNNILTDVWGEVPRRNLTAIMGSSGSGKTSLLNVLSGRITSNKNLSVEADVRVNNYKVDPSDIEVRKKIAFVAQDDSLQITSTPREAIQFSARLRLPRTVPNQEIETLTDRMLEELGLEECADTIVGGALIKGISGGERKRTSVGVELVTCPTLVFLDEPTSGLDSFNAVKLCQVLKKVANAGASVLFTIHQPSSVIFRSFDQLILLHKGRVMYQGPVEDVNDHFANCGQPIPMHYNPADWVIEVALTHSVEELQESGFYQDDARALEGPFEPDSTDFLGITNAAANGCRDELPIGMLGQAQVLFLRELKNLRRNTHALRIRVAMTLMISLLTGFLFYQIADKNFNEFINVQSTFGALLMANLANMLATVFPNVLAFPEQRPVFLREYSTNHYSAFAYVVSSLSMELVMTGFQVTLSTILTYFLVGFNQGFGEYWAGIYLLACTSTALAVLTGCAVTDAKSAVEFIPAQILPQILFAGFFVPPDLIPDWLAWIRYICPLTYGVGISLANEFGEGRCNDELGPNGENYCWTVLEHAGVDPDDTWWYFLVLLGIFVCVRILALILLTRKANKFY